MSYDNLNNYDDGFNKAREKISNAQKKHQLNSCFLPINGNVGPTGPTGPAGRNGLTPNFSIGTVTTGSPGTEATVTIKEV